jgi:hypothetical protein
VASARNGFVFAVVGVELIDVLADVVGLDAVARQEGERLLKDFEFPEGRKFVEHEE